MPGSHIRIIVTWWLTPGCTNSSTSWAQFKDNDDLSTTLIVIAVVIREKPLSSDHCCAVFRNSNALTTHVWVELTLADLWLVSECQIEEVLYDWMICIFRMTFQSTKVHTFITCVIPLINLQIITLKQICYVTANIVFEELAWSNNIFEYY